jgi:HEPN domain-containing protein
VADERLEIADHLISGARTDLGAARELEAIEDPRDNVLGFHLQQAVEKSLKAVLVLTGAEAPATHNLVELVDRLRGAGLEPPPAVVRTAAWLTPWAALFDESEDAHDLDRDAALEAATEAVAFAQEAPAKRRAG